jgi:hypothetical protein
MPDGAYWQWLHTRHLAISIAEARRTHGALMFMGDGTGTGRNAIYHVAFSLGDGRTFDLDAGIKALRTYVVLPAAKSHHLRHGGFAESMNQAFPLQDRTDVAEYLARSLIAEWRLGNTLS